MSRRSLPTGVHVLAGLCFVLAVAVWVIGDATIWQVLLTLAVAVALAVLVVLVIARTDRFRFGLIMLGWVVAAFAAGGLAQDGEGGLLAATLLYPAVLFESMAFFDISPQRYRSDARRRRRDDAAS